MSVTLAGLVAADDPAAWARLGFAVGTGGTVVLGEVVVVLEDDGERRGLTALSLDGAAGDEVDGIPVRAPAARAAPAGPHPNGALGVDHVVVTTPALDRTLAALERARLEVRRTRDVPGEARLRQAFLLAGPSVLEVVGPPGHDGDGPAALWGLTVVVPDVDHLAAGLGALAGRPRDAVQPGRRIVTAARQAGAAVRLAFMTARPPREAVRVERP